MTDLTALRAELDGIDDAVHDLLIRRAAVVQVVGARKGGGARLRPGREAAIMRRLLARHAGGLAPAALVRIWREVLAGSVALQGPFAVAVADGLSDLARAQFGLLTPLLEGGDPLAAVRGGAASAAVMPVEGAWWRRLDGLHIVARLPFFGAAAREAFVVADAAPDPSGDDHTLVAVDGALVDLVGWVAAGDPRLAALDAQAQVVGAYATPITSVTP